MTLDDGREVTYSGQQCPFTLSEFSQESFIVRSYYASQGSSPLYETADKPLWLDEGESVCGGVEREAREEEMRKVRRNV